MRLSALVLPLLALVPTPALADVAGRYRTIDRDALVAMDMTIEADDAGNVRVQMGGMSAYYVFREGNLFIVQRGSTGLVVARASDMMTVANEAMQRMGASRLSERAGGDLGDFDLAPMGEEVVNGRTGMAYGIRPKPGEKPVYASFVISSDPRLAPLGRALAQANEGMVQDMGSLGTMLTRVNGEIQQVMARGAPLRILGIALTDVSYEKIPQERFALPVEPVTIQQMRAMAEPFPAPPTLSSSGK